MSSSSFLSHYESGSSRAGSLCAVDLQHNPFYPFTGHPLVYYAQIPGSYSSRQRSRGKKDNPNCFVKAFRWYTQEHNVRRSPEYVRPADTAGFASWLDRKYDQFLTDSQLENSAVSHQRVTSSIRIITNEPFKSRNYKYKRCWGRRQAANSSRDGGDGCRKYNQSFEIILHPKDLSRPASECCFQNKPEPCCDTPRVTVVSSDTEIMSQNSKIQNHAALIQEAEIRVARADETVTKLSKFNDDESVIKAETLNSASSVHRKKNGKQEARNVSCQCPEEHVGNVETGTQCATTATTVKSSEGKNKQLSQSHLKETTVCECPNHIAIDSGTQYFLPESTKVAEVNSNIETKANQEKVSGSTLLQKSQVIIAESKLVFRRSVEIPCTCTTKQKEQDQTRMVSEGSPTAQAAAQTSDCSIILDKVATGGLPLLVRVTTRQ